MTPRISIITATFNSEKTLKACLSSVAEQTALSDIEHIIVDGASSDNSLNIVKNYPHIAKVVSEKDRGIYHAFNKGLALSTADIIYFLNSDDELVSPDTIKNVLNNMSDDDFFVCGRIIVVDNVSGAQAVSLKYGEPHFNPKHQAFFARRELFKKIGPFNECFSIAADGYFMHRAVNSFNGKFVDDVICKFRTGGLSSQNNNLYKLRQEYKIISELLDVKLSRMSVDDINLSLKNKNTALLTLITRISSDSFDTQRFAHKKIAIFGFRDISVVVKKLLKLRQIETECFIATQPPPEAMADNLPVLNVEQLKNQPVDVVINGIEGSHEPQISDMLRLQLPLADVLSWRDL